MSPRRSLLAVLLALVVITLVGGQADAGKKKKKGKAKKDRYAFVLGEVRADDGVAGVDDVLPMLRAEATKQFAANPRLVADLSGAPDPAADPKAYKKWLAAQKAKGAYTVHIDVTTYREELEDSPKGEGQKRLAVRLELHMFGDTIPERKMGFEGTGSSTVKQDVGKKMRPSDREYTVQGAVELAITDAIAECLAKLSAKK